MSEQKRDYGEEVDVSVPRRALGLVLERAEIEFDELEEYGEASPESLEDIEGALDLVKEALDEAVEEAGLDPVEDDELLDVVDYPTGGDITNISWYDENTIHVESETDTRRVIERYEFVRAEEYPKEE